MRQSYARWRVQSCCTRKSLRARRSLRKISLSTHEALRGAVSVVIPCHNEEMNVGPLVERILDLYGEYIHEVIPVDDDSTDRTREVMAALATKDARIKPFHRSPPNGVGRAVSDGLRAATGRYVFTIDCDFQHLLPEFRDLFDGAAEGNDVVVGSRFSRHSVLLNYPFAKIFANRAFHALAVLLFRRRIRDVTNDLKIMRREVVLDLRLRQPGFAVNAETGLQPLLLGYRVKQAPCPFLRSTARRAWEHLPFASCVLAAAIGRCSWDCGLIMLLASDRTATLAVSAG